MAKDTVDVILEVPMMPAEVAREAVEWAKKCGAVNSYVTHKNGRSKFVAEFLEPEKAALFSNKMSLGEQVPVEAVRK
jgi:hypothetical protein